MQEIYLKHSLQVFPRMDMLILKHILDCDHLSYIAKLDDDTQKKKKKKRLLTQMEYLIVKMVRESSLQHTPD